MPCGTQLPDMIVINVLMNKMLASPGKCLILRSLQMPSYLLLDFKMLPVIIRARPIARTPRGDICNIMVTIR